jgi:C1A family cysteine protease
MNKKRYDALNRRGTAVYGLDQDSDLTSLEFSSKYGCLDDTPTTTNLWKPTVEQLMIAENSTIDWRNHDGKRYVTNVKDQGQFGACWSFGVSGNLEGLTVRQGFNLANISEQELIDCCKDCDGRVAEKSFEWLNTTSSGHPVLESTYPYIAKYGTCSRTKATEASVKLNSWGRVHDDGTGAPVVAGLFEHGPMGMGVDATCFQGYKKGVISECKSQGIDHAVLMVGAGKDPASGLDYFTIKNSWVSEQPLNTHTDVGARN